MDLSILVQFHHIYIYIWSICTEIDETTVQLITSLLIISQLMDQWSKFTILVVQICHKTSHPFLQPFTRNLKKRGVSERHVRDPKFDFQFLSQFFSCLFYPKVIKFGIEKFSMVPTMKISIV